MEDAISSPVLFSYGAVNKIKQLVQAAKSKPNQYLRVGVKHKSGNDTTYVLDFDAKQNDDKIYKSDGFKFIINNKHLAYLYGMEIDWQDRLNNHGFIFKNPNEKISGKCSSDFIV